MTMATAPVGAMPSAPGASPRLTKLLAAMPLAFVEDRGRGDRDAAYHAAGPGGAVRFSRRGVDITLPSAVRRSASSAMGAGVRPAASSTSAATIVHQDFVGTAGVEPRGERRLATRYGYLTGGAANWRTSLPGYQELRYRELWPGIDLVYSGDGGHLKYTLTVEPGADPRQIQLAYNGVTGMAVTPSGALRVDTRDGSFSDTAPLVYQETDAGRVLISSSFDVLSPVADDRGVYTFRVGEYDQERPLIIDPTILLYSGYVAEIPIEEPFSFFEPHFRVALDGSRNAYIVGVTMGINTADEDVFVAKVNAAGTALEYVLQLGGDQDDWPAAIAVDAEGAAYITGRTGSDEASFPVIGGPSLVHGGDLDAFVAKILPDGSALEYCGYLGGAQEDSGYAIAVEDLPGGGSHAYVLGNTRSNEATFPVALGPDLTFGGVQDGFVASVNAAGTGLEWCGYVGGDGYEMFTAMSRDVTGRLNLAGNTVSTPATLPLAVGPSLTTNGIWPGYLARLDPATFDFDYAGFIDGVNPLALAAGPDQAVYLAGYTWENESVVPVVIGPDLVANNPNDQVYTDGIVAKVKPDGSGLDYCGFIGGEFYDIATDVAVDPAGHAFVSGVTGSTEATFPAVDGPDLTFNGGPEGVYGDAFVAKVSPDGASLIYSGFVGGSGADRADGIALDAEGNAYIVGATSSTETTFPLVVGPYGSYDASLPLAGSAASFIAKISGEPPATATSTPTSTPTTTFTPTPTLTPSPEPTISNTPPTGPTEVPTSTPHPPVAEGCPASPQTGCVAAPRARVAYRNPTDPKRRRFSYRWLRGSATLAQLGDGVTTDTDYDVCVYDGSALVAAYTVEGQGQCDGKTCWRQVGKHSRTFRSKKGNVDGVSQLRLHEGAGRASIRVLGRGANLSIPAFSPGGGAVVQVRMHGASGEGCWETQFSAPAKVNNATRFSSQLP